LKRLGVVIEITIVSTDNAKLRHWSTQVSIFFRKMLK